jgi:CRP-like cAMP-binding protein
MSPLEGKRHLVNLISTPASILASLLSRYARLGSEPELVLTRVCGPIRHVRAGACVDAAEGPAGLFLVLSGWLSEERSLADGRRQILRLCVPGEAAGHCGLRTRGRSCLVALTDAAVVDISGLRALIGGSPPPELSAAWWGLCEARDEEALRHIVRLGRMTALERTAHVILELFERLSKTELVRGRVMPVPLTQEQLSHYLGISVVHVNRILQQLRRDRLIEIRHRLITVLDIPGLAALCGYPTARASASRAGAPAAGSGCENAAE